MRKSRQHTKYENLPNICAWCDKTIPKNTEVFGLGVKGKQGVDLSDKEGKIISLFLVLENKTVPAVVATRDSQAKKDGKDILFMTCSKSCAGALKDALDKEKDLSDEIDLR